MGVTLTNNPEALVGHILELSRYAEALNDIKIRSEETIKDLRRNIDGMELLQYYEEKARELDECSHYFNRLAEELNEMRNCYTEIVCACPPTDPMSSDLIV